MPAIRHDQLLLRLLRDVNDIRSALRRVTVNLPLFDIANENTPAQLTGDQNNYVIGNYDILRLDSSIDVTITGLRGGIKGRSLRIFNVGANRVTLSHSNASSDAENRFNIVGGEDVALFPDGNVYLYYDSTQQRWIVPEQPSWFGQYGLTTYAYAAVQNIGSGADTLITNWTITKDDWNMFDTVNSKIVIPDDGLYLGVLAGNYDWNVNGYRAFKWSLLGSFVASQTIPAITAAATLTSLSCPMMWPLSKDDEVTMYATQNSGSGLNINNVYVGLTRVF